MRKAQKRELGRLKQEENLRKSQELGLKMQKLDNDRRERELQEALIRREKKAKKGDVPEGPRSKISQEKKDRVEKRLKEREAELDRLNEIEQINLKRREDLYEMDVDAELDRTQSNMDEIMEDYAKADVDLTINLLDTLFPPLDDEYESTQCKYGCQFASHEEHEKICPGNVSFRTQFVEHG